MALGSARRALQPSARRGAGALWPCAPGRVREAPCRPRRVRIGVGSRSLGWAAGHWGSQFAYPNGWFPAPMRIACPDADRRAREGSAGGQSACRRPTALSHGGGARGRSPPLPQSSSTGAQRRGGGGSGAGDRLAAEAAHIGAARGGALHLPPVGPAVGARTMSCWVVSVLVRATGGRAQRKGAQRHCARCGRGGFAALRCCGPCGLVPVLRARGCGEGLCVWCVVGVLCGSSLRAAGSVRRCTT